MEKELKELQEEGYAVRDKIYERLVQKEIDLIEMFAGITEWETEFSKRVSQIIDRAAEKGELLRRNYFVED